MYTPLSVLGLLTVTVLPLSILKAAPSGKSERGLTVRLVASEVPEGQAKVFIQANGVKTEPMDLGNNQLSKPITVASRSMELMAVDGEAAVCAITLPEDGKSFAVLLISEKPAGFTPVVVRTDDRTFKAGDVFFVNHTETSIAMQLGGTELVIEPGQTAKSRPTNPVDNTYQITISKRDTSGDATNDKILSSTRWPVDQNVRSYIILTTDDRGKTTYRAVDEFVEARR